MMKRPRGRAVIIGNHSFLTMNSLHGVEYDIQQLTQLFEALHFVVERHINKTAEASVGCWFT